MGVNLNRCFMSYIVLPGRSIGEQRAGFLILLTHNFVVSARGVGSSGCLGKAVFCLSWHSQCLLCDYFKKGTLITRSVTYSIMKSCCSNLFWLCWHDRMVQKHATPFNRNKLKIVILTIFSEFKCFVIPRL